MANFETIARGLSLLHESYPTRPITAETGPAWELMFSGTADEDFLRACRVLAVERGRTFFPTAGEVMDVANPVRPIDTEALLKRISSLGAWNPNMGWLYPRVDDVRKAMGDGIADAYAAAGASRCFADSANDGSSITRDIACRTFATELAIIQRTDPRALAPPEATPLLPRSGPMSGKG